MDEGLCLLVGDKTNLFLSEVFVHFVGLALAGMDWLGDMTLTFVMHG